MIESHGQARCTHITRSRKHRMHSPTPESVVLYWLAPPGTRGVFAMGVGIYLASTASERGRLHVAVPLEGATRAPGIGQPILGRRIRESVVPLHVIVTEVDLGLMLM